MRNWRNHCRRWKTRGTVMIDIERNPILKSSVCTLKETSKDKHDGTKSNDYMIESLLPVVNFDTVKDKYIKDMSLSETPASNDAFYVDSQGNAYFVEFKNGVMNRQKVFKVRLKIFDSLLMLTDIGGVSIADTRDKLTYILVYNEEKNPVPEETEYQVSQSRVAISQHYLHKSNKEFIRFDLERFNKLYFKDVFTVNAKRFNDDFVKKWAGQTAC